MATGVGMYTRHTHWRILKYSPMGETQSTGPQTSNMGNYLFPASNGRRENFSTCLRGDGWVQSSSGKTAFFPAVGSGPAIITDAAFGKVAVVGICTAVGSETASAIVDKRFSIGYCRLRFVHFLLIHFY